MNIVSPGRYFTGKPCKRGHLSERYVADRACVTCKGERSAREHRQHPERSRASSARHFARHRAEVSAKYAEKYETNKTEMLAQRAAYKKANLGRQCAYQKKRNARRASAPGSGVTPERRVEALAAAGGLCSYCAQVKPLTLDHIDPISAGGADDIENVAAACQRCNSSKHKNSLLVWLALRSHQMRRGRAKSGS